MIDLAVMKEIAQDYFVAMVARNHGDPGIEALNILLEFVPHFYQRTAPENRVSGVLIFKHLSDTPMLQTMRGAVQYGSLAHLPPLQLAPLTIQIFGNGTFDLLQGPVVDLNVAAAEGVAYTLDDTVEQFYAKSESARVKNQALGYLSIFAFPTLTPLRAA